MNLYCRIVVPLVLLLACMQVQAQSTTFLLTYHLQGKNILSDGIEMPDHGFLVCGFANRDTFAGGGIYLIRTTALGDTAWTKKINITGCGATGIAPTSDGNYLLTGTIIPGTKASSGIILKITPMGDTLWTKKYTTSGWGCFFDRIVSLPNNHYAVLGYKQKSNSPQGSNVWLLNMDNNGDTLSTHEFKTQVFDVYNCLASVNNQLTVSGRYQDSTSLGGFMLSAYPNTQPIRENHYPFSKLKGIQQLRQPNFYTAVNYASLNSSFLVYTRMGLAKINAAGDTIWSKKYGNYDNRSTNDDVQDLATASDGNLLVAGTYNQDAGKNADFSLIKTDTNGILLWRKQYGDSSYQYLTRAIACSDGGTLMLGLTAANFQSVFNYNVSDIYIVKVDKNGSVTGIKEQTILSTEGSRLYPNPFSQNTIFTYDLPKSITNAFLKIYDIRGSLVHSYLLNSQESTLNISASDFENGVYLYGIEAEGMAANKKKMVVIR